MLLFVTSRDESFLSMFATSHIPKSYWSKRFSSLVKTHNSRVKTHNSRVKKDPEPIEMVDLSIKCSHCERRGKVNKKNCPRCKIIS